MIKPVNVITKNVMEELNHIAKKYVASTSKLYIRVNSITTYIKTTKSALMEMSKNELKTYSQEKYLRDDSIEFEQEYDIDVLSTSHNYPFEYMSVEIEFNENDTLAYLVIKKGSKLNYSEYLHNDFLDYITEQKLRSGILLYLMDVDCSQTVKAFVDVIKKIKTLTFKEDKKILICKGFNEIKSIKAEICMSIEDDYSDDIEEEDDTKVDYADRGFLLNCTEGEELFEFTKPIQGKYGRTCRGDIIEVETIDLNARPSFGTDDSILIEDSFENIKFLASRSGYLMKKGDSYEVSNSIDLDEISFKTTGTIDSDLDIEISINVMKDNPLEDAVEKGMHIKVQQISIKGSTGPHSMIEARDVTIEGQTHEDSSIQCVNANLGLHKGKVIARDVEVKTLEGGEVIADSVKIVNAVRGKITAKTIQVDTLSSHVTLSASQSIQVGSVKGEDNHFIIDAAFSSGFDDKKEDDSSYLDEIKSELKDLQKRYKASYDKLKNNQEPCKKIKATIIKAKNQGKEIPKNLLKNFQICKMMNVKYKKLKEELVYKKDQFESLDKKSESTPQTIFDATIEFKQALHGYNTITYQLNKPERKIELKTDSKMRGKVFKLIEDDEGILRIINTDR